MSLGQQIKIARKRVGMTQAELADSVGLSTITIRQYEADKREPRYNTVEKLAQALNCNISDLIDPKKEAQMIIDQIREISSCFTEESDDFVSMLKNPVIQRLGISWMEFSEKQREQVCKRQGRFFEKLQEPYYSITINGHLATLLVDHGFFPSGYASLVSAGFSYGDAYAIIDYVKAKEKIQHRLWSEEQYQRLERVSDILDKEQQRIHQEESDAKKDNP